MVKHINISIILLFLAALAVSASNNTDTRQGIFNDRVHTLRVHPVGRELAPPIMALGVPDDGIIISFDHLNEDREFLRYELVHCNAEWQPSAIVDSEFLDSFNLGDIDDYEYSQGTTNHYVHYTLALPNQQISPLISGNYLVKIFPENNPDDVWLQARFMVSEQVAAIDADVTSRTDVDYNRSHQQLSLTVDTKRANVSDPFNNLIIKVKQNSREDNVATLTHPLRADGTISVYEHLPQLIFPPGNEYRRFETVSVHYPGMRVDDMQYHHPYYHMALETDQSRVTEQYLYDSTQHGRFVVREFSSTNSDIEADYVVVHFSLDYPEIPGMMVFIDGDLVNRRFDPESVMSFNRATGRYERSMLLKQGSYNYQYLAVPSGTDKGRTDVIEGDKYQTVNEYTILVYNREPRLRYDRLIAVGTIFSGR